MGKIELPTSPMRELGEARDALRPIRHLRA
jgi:hypothetical protein